MSIGMFLLLLVWAGAGVYDALEYNRRPIRGIQYFLAGPVFWVIGMIKWFKQNQYKIKSKCS